MVCGVVSHRLRSRAFLLRFRGARGCAGRRWATRGRAGPPGGVVSPSPAPCGRRGTGGAHALSASGGGAFAAGSVALRGASAPGFSHGQAARGTAGLLRALQAAPAGAAAASPLLPVRTPPAERGSGRRSRRQAEAGGGRGAAGKASRAARRRSSRGAERCGGQAAAAGRARGAPRRADGGGERRQAGRRTGGRPGNDAESGAGRGGRLAVRGGPRSGALRYGAAGPA